VRTQIRAGNTPPTARRQKLGRFTDYTPADTPSTHIGYDGLDALLNGVLRLDPHPQPSVPPAAEMVHCEPTPARAILDLTDRVAFTAQDMFYDIGSGLGQVVMLVHLLTGVPARGIEFDPGYCELQEGLTLAQELAHPISRAYALLWYAKLHEHVGNPAVTLTYAEKTISVATEYSLPLWSTQGVTHRGWALAELGQPEEGAAQIQAGMTAHEQTGARAPRPWHLALLASAYGKLGKFKEALAALDEALALAETNGILDCQAERWRLKGDLLLQSEEPSPGSAFQGEAEACFQRAIEIAQAQQARSLELRAALALSRLWQRQGKQTEARQTLSEIYDWFSEGFDTPDLQAARALLDELS